mgnify:CR=1 FL=1
MNPFTIVILVIGLVFVIGMITFIAGVLVLTLRSASSDVKNLATQTARIAQKGLVDEMSGLVGNASTLVDAMGQLVRTTRGIGIFLCVLGTILMGFACYLALQVYILNL